MAHFMKARTLVNPARKKVKKMKNGKRKLSPLQKLFFGSKRQRAAAKASKARKNPSRLTKEAKGGNRKIRKAAAKKDWARMKYTAARRRTRQVKRYIGNPSRIMTISLPSVFGNPGKKRKKSVKRSIQNMARKHRKSTKKYHRRKRRVSNPFYKARRRRNPGSYRRHHRRTYRRKRVSRNPGKVGGTIGKLGGLVGGAAVTFFLSNMLPATLTQGFLGYITTGLVAVTQGKVIGSVTKNRSLGNAMTTGGLFYLALKVVADLFPSIGGYLPFSLKGMGLITPSNFYVPQVPSPGSMASFVGPAGIPAAVPVAAGMKGIVGNAGFAPSRRTGRLH